jgi:methyl-accepting chemotaxis protein
MGASSKRKARDDDKASGGLSITARFALSMALALTLVMSAAGFLLYQSALRVSRNVQETTLVDAMHWTAPSLYQDFERIKLRAERETYYSIEARVQRDLAQAARDFPEGSAARNAITGYQTSLRDEIRDSREERESKLVELGSVPLTPAPSDAKVSRGTLEGTDVGFYRVDGKEGLPAFHLYLPDSTQASEQSLLGLVLGATLAVILAGAIVSVWVANQVARPLSEIIEDIRHISTGDLSHRTRAKSGGEIGTLARAIDRMTNSLAAARENEVELQVRQREVEVAAEVREQLLPQTTPKLPGYDIGALHIGAAENPHSSERRSPARRPFRR